MNCTLCSIFQILPNLKTVSLQLPSINMIRLSSKGIHKTREVNDIAPFSLLICQYPQIIYPRYPLTPSPEGYETFFAYFRKYGLWCSDFDRVKEGKASEGS